jgi:arabinogalactan endo-1,4-beta-galactosidase
MDPELVQHVEAENASFLADVARATSTLTAAKQQLENRARDIVSVLAQLPASAGLGSLFWGGFFCTVAQSVHALAGRRSAERVGKFHVVANVVADYRRWNR